MNTLFVYAQSWNSFTFSRVHSKPRKIKSREKSVNPTESVYHWDLQVSDGPRATIGVFVEYGNLQVAVEHRLHVARPVLVTLQFTRLDALGQHHNGATVELPDHAPEVVARRRQRTLSGDELALRAETLSDEQQQRQHQPKGGDAIEGRKYLTKSGGTVPRRLLLTSPMLAPLCK